jgi:hypothetical protein
MSMERPFRVVQPWGRDPNVESTTVSVHATADETFAEIERLADRIIATGDRSDAITLVVIGPDGRVVERRSH